MAISKSFSNFMPNPVISEYGMGNMFANDTLTHKSEQSIYEQLILLNVISYSKMSTYL